MINIIAAVAANGVIGSDGQIPWDIPEDRKYFKKITNGSVVIMGRRTYEDIGCPLPGRFNIVISSKAMFIGNMLCTVRTMKKALTEARRFLDAHEDFNDIYICGGSQVYKTGLKYAKKLYLTELYDEYPGDVYFPEFDREKYRIAECTEHPKLRLRFCVYERLTSTRERS